MATVLRHRHASPFSFREGAGRIVGLTAATASFNHLELWTVFGGDAGSPIKLGPKPTSDDDIHEANRDRGVA